MGVR
jgi:mannan polymerase II complex MNN11 subunit